MWNRIKDYLYIMIFFKTIIFIEESINQFKISKERKNERKNNNNNKYLIIED